jgi:hypothetical protein
MDRWPQYARVRLVSDRLEADGVSRGSLGYIVEVYEDAYEVEVSDGSGRTVFLGAVPDIDLELVDATSA